MSNPQALLPVETKSGQLEHVRSRLPANDRLDLSESIGFFAKWYKLMLAVIALCILIGLVVSLVMPKTYRAQATVMLEREASAISQAAPTAGAQAAISHEVVETQMEIITSRNMIDQVIDALGLAKGKSAAERQEIRAVLRSHVGTRRSGESYALTISYDDADPQQAARIANEFAHQFANWELNEDRRSNSQARGMVEERLAALRAEAQADTQALQQYRIANNLLSTSGASLTEQEISNYDQEVARARAAAAEEEARLNTALAQLRSGSTGDDVGEALGSTVISSLRTQEAQVAAQVANLSARYGPNHPELMRLRQQLEEVRSGIQAEIGRVISNLRARATVSQQRLASLTASLNSAKGKLSQNNSAMVGLSDLERAAAASQGIYETYLTSYKQLLAAEGTERPGAKVITLAAVPTTPLSPNIKLNLGLAAIIGLGAALLAAYIAESLSLGITSPDEIEQDLGENFLGSIPLLSSIGVVGAHAISAIRDDPRSIFAESFRALAASIDQASEGNDLVIAVTSALPNEGKTVISCCLAHTLAMSGLRTILIDCDLRRRGISRLLNVQPSQTGLVDVLNGISPLNVENGTGEYVFCILPISPSEDEPEHLLTGQPFIELLEQLRGNFDRIILDLPPVLPVAATRKLASRADAVVVAACWRTTSKFAVRAALKRLPPDLVNVVGVVLSKVDMRRRALFGRHDPGFYYAKYKEYYS